jgi:hypothetical protein
MYDNDLNQVTALVSSVAGQPIIMLSNFHDTHLAVHYVFQRAGQARRVSTS